MIDTAEVSRNTTNNQVIEIVRSTLLTLVFFFFCVFLFFVMIILHIFCTVPYFRENARYVLFIHMLINDTLLLLVALLLLFFVTYSINIPVPICYGIVTFTNLAFQITPYNLAVMSLERYTAICHPLRHAQLCSVHRSLRAIIIMWALALAFQLLDFIALCFSMPRNFFSTSMICMWSSFVMNQTQQNLRTLNIIGTFTMVGLVIFFTYLRVVKVAWKIDSRKSSAFKAEKTVLLHAFQLFLCLTSLTSTFTERYLREYFFFIPITNFILFMCIPRFISPLIYGLRDAVLQKYIKRKNLSKQLINIIL